MSDGGEGGIMAESDRRTRQQRRNAASPAAPGLDLVGRGPRQLPDGLGGLGAALHRPRLGGRNGGGTGD